jgi:Uma2 family endonuclease
VRESAVGVTTNMPGQATRRLFTVDEFYQMADAGILSEDDRVELLAGEIVEMTPIGSRHAACVKRLAHLFMQRAGDFIVSIQDPVRLDQHSEPQPDLAIVNARPDFYRQAHPGPADVRLIIEVADSSAEIDRRDKVPLYGRSGIPEVWVVDLNAQQVDVYTVPTTDGYERHETLGAGGVLRPRPLPGLELRVDDVTR